MKEHMHNVLRLRTGRGTQDFPLSLPPNPRSENEVT